MEKTFVTPYLSITRISDTWTKIANRSPILLKRLSWTNIFLFCFCFGTYSNWCGARLTSPEYLVTLVCSLSNHNLTRSIYFLLARRFASSSRKQNELLSFEVLFPSHLQIANNSAAVKERGWMATTTEPLLGNALLCGFCRGRRKIN